MKTCLVVGLGRFGAAVAGTLQSLGKRVTAIEKDEEKIRQQTAVLSGVVVGDAAEETLLDAVHAERFDCAILSFDKDFAAAILLVMSLKSRGVAQVICLAADGRQQQALLQVGADYVLLPEQGDGAWLARKLAEQERVP